MFTYNVTLSGGEESVHKYDWFSIGSIGFLYRDLPFCSHLRVIKSKECQKSEYNRLSLYMGAAPINTIVK